MNCFACNEPVTVGHFLVPSDKKPAYLASKRRMVANHGFAHTCAKSSNEARVVARTARRQARTDARENSDFTHSRPERRRQYNAARKANKKSST